MNLTRAFIIFVGISILLIPIHFIITYEVSSNDIPVLYNIYGFVYLVGVPAFWMYLFVQEKYRNYIGHIYFFCSLLKMVLSIAWVLYLIKLLELDIKYTFLNFLVVLCVFITAELIPLFKLMNKKKK
ncbi:MAG: hypothetical protein ACK5HU_06630 [Flavobacteriales bacterium]